MKKVLLSVLIVVLTLTMLTPVDMVAGSPQPMADSQMAQITGGSIIECGYYGTFGYCCFDLWIFSVCFLVGIGGGA